MEYKTHRGRVQMKAAAGSVSAVISTLDLLDSDGDMTLPGAFTNGQKVMISEWNHSAVTGPHPPVGKGTIRVIGREAIVDLQLFADQPRGQAMADLLVAMGDMQEWSYAFKILDSERINMGGKMVRLLKKLDVYEASPVYRGAGVNTRTVTAKDEQLREELARLFVRSIANLQDIPVAANTQEAIQREYLRFAAAR